MNAPRVRPEDSIQPRRAARPAHATGRPPLVRQALPGGGRDQPDPRVWTDGDRLYPTDYRVYHKAADGKTENDRFRDRLAASHACGRRPRCVLFDGWYASPDNFKLVRGSRQGDGKVRIAG